MDLVERERELDVLHAAVRASPNILRNTTIVAGSEGTGKSELLATFALGLDKALILFAAGSRAERDIPFSLLRQLVRNSDIPQAAKLAVDRLDRLGRIDKPPPVSQFGNTFSLSTRRPEAHLLDILCDLLIAESKRRAVVILIDDVNEADVRSLSALSYLQRRFSLGRIVLVISRPTLVAEPANRAAHLTGRLLTLLPLSPQAVGTLVARVLGQEWAAVHTAEVHEITSGNPRLVNAVIDDQLVARRSNALAAGVVVGESFAHAYWSTLHRPDGAVAVAQHVVLVDQLTAYPVSPIAGLLYSTVPAGADNLAGFSPTAPTAATRTVIFARTRDLRAALPDAMPIEQINALPNKQIDSSHRRRRTPRADLLSEAERRVAALAATGNTNRQIGAKLFITVSTVEQHLTRIYRKLGVTGRAELVPLLRARPAVVRHGAG